MDVVYSDDTDPYGPGAAAFAAPSGGGGGAAAGGSSSSCHTNAACSQCATDCCVPAWGAPCHQWASNEASCISQGGEWCDQSAQGNDPDPEPEPTPVVVVPDPDPVPTPIVADPVPTPVVADPVPTPVQSSGSCCWSAWGGACATYSGTGGKCSNNWQTSCNSDADCGAGLLELHSRQDGIDVDSCQWTSISDLASNIWCEQNCVAASGLHPACDPDTDADHRICLCNTKTSLMQTPATKFSGGVTGKAKVVRHANVDAAGHLRLDA